MKIQQIQNNNTNFQGLHMDKNACKYMRHCGLLNNSGLINHSGIKECADKFEVVVKKEKSKVDKPDWKELLHSTGIVAGVSLVSGALSGSATIVATQVLGILNPAISILIGGALGFMGMATYLCKSWNEYDNEYSLQVGKNVRKSSFGKTELETPISKKYKITYTSFDDFTNLVRCVKENDQRQFINDVRKYEKNGIYEPRELLKILNDDEIKQNYKNGECFNYKLENNNNDTMLTKFLDIVPTKENEKDYQEIIKFMRKTKNIDYKQVDSNGISVIEKIINSENSDLLDLVKETEFDYSKELDCAYERIDNTEFKDRVKNLKINFPNIKEAVRLNSQQALQKLLPELKSPFCNVKTMVNDLSENVGFDNLSNFISFCEDNGIDTSDIIL